MIEREREKLERGMKRVGPEKPPTPEQSSRRNQLEKSLSRLRGVRQARVRGDADRVEVTVLTLPETTEQGAAADVRRLAARAGFDPATTDVKVMGPRPTAVPARRKLSSLSTKRYDQRFSAQVTLELEGDALMGEVDVPAGRRFEIRSVARAVLESVRPLIPFALQLEQVDIFNFGPERLAVVSVSSREDVLIGSALVKGDELDAVARATLDAVNRVLQLDPTALLRAEKESTTV